MTQGGDIWVFGYGSLMWNPGFAYLSCAPALLRGYHRAMCVYSHVWRGSPERPGLVLGLDRGGACRGVAYRVAAADAQAVIEYLDARERVTDVYLRRVLPIRIGGGRPDAAPAGGREAGTARGTQAVAGGVAVEAGGNGEPRTVAAVSYIVDRAHDQYAGRLSPDVAARLIRQGTGRGGANTEYLANTLRHLDEMGLAEGPLHDIAKRLETE